MPLQEASNHLALRIKARIRTHNLTQATRIRRNLIPGPQLLSFAKSVCRNLTRKVFLPHVILPSRLTVHITSFEPPLPREDHNQVARPPILSRTPASGKLTWAANCLPSSLTCYLALSSPRAAMDR
ncbi:hypothetical protein M422DRAFT_269928 [Sphaerobolus stellatus SS14]|uniref:Uncharacterized protein n=1 Tax=Sphaerobolus stellatus (strain SS14) TaxID=990650 RepID=A0A0C9UU37_SPHS4|nr:hypothetical protein M422DRAFT_269928 [Sphaerobolus stellatus SS14]